MNNCSHISATNSLQFRCICQLHLSVVKVHRVLYQVFNVLNLCFNMDVELSAEPTECKTQLNHLVRADFDIDYFSSRLYFIIYSECHRSFVVCSNL